MRDMGAALAASIDAAVQGDLKPSRPKLDIFAEVERMMAEVRQGPPPIWRYLVSSKVPTIKRQWRSDGRLVVWLPRFFYDSLRRERYAGFAEFAAVPGARFGTPVEVLDD